jgi:hypothetical protein
MNFDEKDVGQVFRIGEHKFTITAVDHGPEDPDTVRLDFQFMPPAPASYSYVQQSAADAMAEEILRSLDICAECRNPDPSVATVRTLVRAFYARPGNGCGGHLHIVLDDGNLEDDHIDFCIAQAVEAKDAEAEALGRVLRAMTPRQRQRVYDGSGPDAMEQMKEALDHAR